MRRERPPLVRNSITLAILNRDHVYLYRKMGVFRRLGHGALSTLLQGYEAETGT
jgi:hypothetical protein